MSKKEKLLAALLGLLFFALVAIEFFAPAEVDWTKTYSQADRIPFGCYILYDQLDQLFPNSQKSASFNTLSEWTAQHVEDDPFEKHLLIISEYLELSKWDEEALQDFILNGGQAWVSATAFPPGLSDSLGIHPQTDWAEYFYDISADNGNWRADSVKGAVLVREGVAPKNRYYFGRSTLSNWFEIKARSQVEILGTLSDGRPNYVRVRLGEGVLYLHANPLIFTNYHLLDPKVTPYIAGVFAHLEDRSQLAWDEYYKTYTIDPITRKGVQKDGGLLGGSSPFRVLLRNPPLRWALYLIFGTIFLFMIFNAKRKQRAIPVVKPLENESVDFAKTIGQLYFLRRNHQQLAEKKILFFNEHLRSRYYLRGDHTQPEFLKTLSLKSGVDLETLTDLFRFIDAISAKGVISEQELLLLNQKIENFYQCSKIAST